MKITQHPSLSLSFALLGSPSMSFARKNANKIQLSFFTSTLQFGACVLLRFISAEAFQNHKHTRTKITRALEKYSIFF